MSKYLIDKFKDLSPYIPGEQLNDKAYIKLNTNENPYPPSPKVIQAVNSSVVESLNLYPELSDSVGEIIARQNGIPKECITTTNSSDEALSFCFQAFCDDNTPPCFADITYGFYRVFAGINQLTPKIIPLTDDYNINPVDYYASNHTIFIANPNAPTGIYLGLDKIEDILNNNKSNIVVIDEAYIDFGNQSALKLLTKHDNLIVVQTFSKSRSMAGARLGFAAASADIISDINKMKFSFNPYPINRMTMKAGTAALEDDGYFNDSIKKILDVRDYSYNEFIKRGFKTLPSAANFIFTAPMTISGKEYYLKLRENGILVRYFDQDRIKDFVRITIGTQSQMERFFEITDKIIKRG